MQSIEIDEKIENKKKDINPIIDFIQSIVVAIAICLVIYIFIATPNQIDGESMMPNFKHGDIILTFKLNQWLGSTDFGKSIGLDYKRGDVVVFQKPGFNDFIKRVIALPGEKIMLREGHIYINGHKLIEDYLPNNLETKGGSFLKDNGNEVTVPENQYFIMGDNRGNSHDSRYLDIEFIQRDWMKGRVLLKYWPIQNFGGVMANPLIEDSQ